MSTAFELQDYHKSGLEVIGLFHCEHPPQAAHTHTRMHTHELVIDNGDNLGGLRK